MPRCSGIESRDDSVSLIIGNLGVAPILSVLFYRLTACADFLIRIVQDFANACWYL